MHMKIFICDAPARAFLKNIIYHTEYSSCERREEEGEWLGKVVFNSRDTFPRRTDEMFSQNKTPEPGDTTDQSRHLICHLVCP